MKYDILVQKGGFLYVKACLWIYLMVRKQYLPKKISKLFQPKIGGKKLSESNSGYSKTKKKGKKWHGPLIYQGGGEPQWSDH